MTDFQPRRDLRPDTGQDWRALGFYLDSDVGQREWRFVGSGSGLRTLTRMLMSQADKAEAGGMPAALPIGPYEDLQIRIWERRGIDDESIHGPPDALRHLSQLIADRLAVTQPGQTFRIDDEYIRNAEYGLVFVVKDDSFDPASAVLLVEPVSELASSAASDDLSSVAFYFYDENWSGDETAGLVRLEADEVVFEFQTTDAFGEEKSEVEVVPLPLDRISAVKFKRGMVSSYISIQTRDMKSLEAVPTSAQGLVRLYVKRGVRDDAEQFTNALHRLIKGLE